MKPNQGYLIHEIAGVPYLLPYGQNVADHRRSMRLNESGVLLLKALEKLDIPEDSPAPVCQNMVEQELLSVLLSHYQDNAPEASQLLSDIRSFLRQLHRAGLLTFPAAKKPLSADYYFRIGNLTLGVCGPENCLEPSLLDFSCGEVPAPDQMIRIIPEAPAIHPNGEILIRTRELVICRNETHYLLLYPADYGIAEIHITLDGSAVDCYCPDLSSPDLTEKLFHAIRFPFLLKAQMNGLFAIHSASIEYENAAWLFSAPAGTGKSTHAALWSRLYQTPLLNGDLNLIGIEDDTAVVYGIPWCGTSGCYTTGSTPLGGITFLRQAALDHAHRMTKEAAQHSIVQRLISPSWTQSMLCSNLDFAAKLTGYVPFYLLECTAEPSAAAAIRQKIDRDIDASSRRN